MAKELRSRVVMMNNRMSFYLENLKVIANHSQRQQPSLSGSNNVMDQKEFKNICV